MEFIGWMLGIAWKVLCLVGGFMLFRYVVHNGKGTMKDILDTLSIFLKTAGHWIRKTCLNYLRKEEQEGDKTHVEATVK